MIGNFSRARQVKPQPPNAVNANTNANVNVVDTSDLMSVCGVPDFSCEEMERLMKMGEQVT